MHDKLKAFGLIALVSAGLFLTYNIYRVEGQPILTSTSAIVISSFASLPNGSLMQIALTVAYVNPALDFTSNNVLYRSFLVNVTLPTTVTQVKAAEITAIDNQIPVMNALFGITLPVPVNSAIILKGDY
jgi:hypothetical protein